MRIALIADSHLSERAPECASNWAAASAFASDSDVALTVHLGDISLDGQTAPADLAFAADRVRTWPTPLRCVPGNHDMGNGCGEERLSSRALHRCRAAFGSDRWVEPRGAWRLVGMNAQLLGTGSAEEERQWDWLERDAALLIESGEDAILFLHRPLQRAPRDASMPTGRYVPPDAARRVLSGPLKNRLRVVVSGHTHQALDFVENDVRHIWVPSCAFWIADRLQTTVGRKVVGIGIVTLSKGGFDYAVHAPPRMEQHELTQCPWFSAPH